LLGRFGLGINLPIEYEAHPCMNIRKNTEILRFLRSILRGLWTLKGYFSLSGEGQIQINSISWLAIDENLRIRRITVDKKNFLCIEKHTENEASEEDFKVHWDRLFLYQSKNHS
jgi:hypothetical protein